MFVLCVLPWVEREEPDWYLQTEPHTLRCPTVQVKGLVVFRWKNVTHNVITVSAEMELEAHLMPLLDSLLKTSRQNYLFTA